MQKKLKNNEHLEGRHALWRQPFGLWSANEITDLDIIPTTSPLEDVWWKTNSIFCRFFLLSKAFCFQNWKLKLGLFSFWGIVWGWSFLRRLILGLCLFFWRENNTEKNQSRFNVWYVLSRSRWVGAEILLSKNLARHSLDLLCFFSLVALFFSPLLFFFSSHFHPASFFVRKKKHWK